MYDIFVPDVVVHFLHESLQLTDRVNDIAPYPVVAYS